MSEISGFTWEELSNGAVAIASHGRVLTTLRGGKADRFLDDMDALDDADQQKEMARMTGHFRRHGERQEKTYPDDA